MKELLLQYGVRPKVSSGDNALYTSDIRPEWGALPNITVETVALLPLPSNTSMNEVINMWYQVGLSLAYTGRSK
jgi:hypothetical protein